MSGKLIWCNVPSDNVQQSLQFYATLLGIAAGDFARSLTDKSESYQYPISADGIDLVISNRKGPNESLSCYFEVANLAGTLQHLQSQGATVVVQPTSLPPAAGVQYSAGGNPNDQFALVRDPSGNLVGIGQMTSSVAQKHFKAGSNPLTQDQRNDLQQIKQAGQHLKP